MIDPISDIYVTGFSPSHLFFSINAHFRANLHKFEALYPTKLDQISVLNLLVAAH